MTPRRIRFAVACVVALAGGCNSSAPVPDPLAVGSTAPPIAAEGWILRRDGQWIESTAGAPPDFVGQGEVLVIDVWAWWCGPCVEQTPELTRTYQRFSREGVVFIGLTSEPADTLPQTKRFIESLKIPWATGYGAGATIDALQATAPPTILIVGKDGKIFWHSRIREDIESALRRALAAPAPSSSSESG